LPIIRSDLEREEISNGRCKSHFDQYEQ